MSTSHATKMRWFDRGAEAFERTFPGLIASRVGTNVGGLYMCPLCDRAFSREAIEAGELTAEHVPPGSFGGREFLLTCKECNNDHGSLFDAHARRKESVADMMLGHAQGPLKVSVEHFGISLAANLSRSDDGDWTFDVVGKANSPATIDAFRAAGPMTAGTPLNVTFSGDRFADLGAKMSWLRSGFLALFASTGGYRYSFDPALRVVKRQLRNPETRLIYSWTIEMDHPASSSDWARWKMLLMDEPRCIAVVFGRYVMLYPHIGDLYFYERLEAHIRTQAGRRQQVTVPSYEPIDWEPRFGYKIDDAPATITSGG